MNRQAQKLVNKFNAASIHRMARGNAKDAPTQPLFHYTTEQVLYNIIQSETLWFTSIYYMDDEESCRSHVGPEADDATKVRVRSFLDENQLPNVSVTATAARPAAEG